MPPNPESVFLWIGRHKHALLTGPTSVIQACPFSCAPEERAGILAKIEAENKASTLGVIPQEFLHYMAGLLCEQDDSDPRTEWLAIVALPATNDTPWHWEKAHTECLRIPRGSGPATDAAAQGVLKSWHERHPSFILVGAYTLPMLEALLDLCAEVE